MSLRPDTRWSKAYAIQARSDFDAREQLLRNRRLPHCHQLHYLQMALEKVVKAHQIAANVSPEELRGSHAGIASVIPVIVKHRLSRTPGGAPRWIIASIRDLARRIELLHPAIKDGGAVPENCEYPWADATGEIRVPALYNFAISLSEHPGAIKMLKEVYAMAAELADQELPD